MHQEKHRIKNFGSILLAHPKFPFLLALAAMILTLGSLSVGIVMDDCWHWVALTKTEIFDGTLPGHFGSGLDIFRFLDGDPQHNFALMDSGVIPWWTVRDIKGAFWRPLTSVTHWLDYKLWPEYPVLMHLHSVLWYGLLVVVTALLYRRFMGLTWMAGLAALLFAVDDAHGTAVGFLANRNALIATFFGVLALIAHHRWRNSNWRAGLVVGPLFLLLSLLSKESGVGICAYLIAYALCLDRGSLWQKAKTLLPYVIVVIGWRIIWSWLGYGVNGIGWYIDPICEPVRFLAFLPQRFIILLQGQWSLPPADFFLFMGAKKTWLLSSAVVLIFLLTIVIFPLLRHNRQGRFWALGMLLAVIPACTTAPSDRLLFFVGIGAMGVLVQFWFFVFSPNSDKPKNLPWRGIAKFLAIVMILVHLIVAPIFLYLRATYPFGPPDAVEKYHVRIDADDNVLQQDLIIVNPPVPMLVGYFPVMQKMASLPVPKRMRILSSFSYSVEVFRQDENTLIVRPEHGFVKYHIDKLFRNENSPMSLGEQVKLTGMTVKVTELTDDGRAAAAQFTFGVPLEDTSLRWIKWDQDCFKPFSPPAIGQSVKLKFR
ncbi:MAG: hypothetical protein JXD22_06735 [Sedimentisphaerales bacterium]|nr:hypothetical protein [Sedimentisphaerales bacterium]